MTPLADSIRRRLSAIDLKMYITRVQYPEQDRVNVVLSGRFLPHRTY
jgi:cyanate lyase